MTNEAIYNHFRLAGIDSRTSALAADEISITLEDGNKDNKWLAELLQDFINLYGMNAETAFSELKEKLI